MAIFPSQSAQKKDVPSFASDLPLKDLVDSTPKTADFPNAQPPTSPTPAATLNPQPVRQASATAAAKESVIAADLTIEGKIQGNGHVRIAGKFKGDVDVKGDLTLEQGAKLTGSVRADKVTLSGELDGNIEAAKRVDLLSSSAINGDIKADDLTIASGARLRGHVECGAWDSKASKLSRTDSDEAAA